MSELDAISDSTLRKLSPKDLDALGSGDLSKLSEVGFKIVEMDLTPSQSASTPSPNLPQELTTRQKVGQAVRPYLEGGMAVGGGLLGAGAGPLGAVAGGALGYAGGKNISDLIAGDYAGTPMQTAQRTAKDIGTGAMYEMGGQSVMPALSLLGKGTAAVVKPAMGKLSGVGRSAIDEAIESGVKGTGIVKSTTEFDKALRGQTSSDEILTNVKDALSTLKDTRQTNYQSKLKEVEAFTGNIDPRPIKQKLIDMMSRYRVSVDSAGNIDTSVMGMNKAGRDDVVDVIKEISTWKDNTPLGLDSLKRRLDDFYSDSGQARQFVQSLKKSVVDAITDKVPAYADMTKGYSDATSLIKDVEADLMLRKQGMSGRITADKTLRRLISSMKDNFEMRKELLDVMGKQADQDLSGQVAGYAMNDMMPRGLVGQGVAGGAGISLAMINPKFLPILAASSPRVQGEFLRLIGTAKRGMTSVGPTLPKALAQQTMIQNRNQNKPNQFEQSLLGVQ